MSNITLRNFIRDGDWRGTYYDQAKKDEILSDYLNTRGVALMIDYLSTLKLDITKECMKFQGMSFLDSDLSTLKETIRELSKKWIDQGKLGSMFEAIDIQIESGCMGIVAHYDERLQSFHDLEFAKRYALALPAANMDFYKFMERRLSDAQTKKSETVDCFLLTRMASDLTIKAIYMLTRVKRMAYLISGNIEEHERNYVERDAVTTALMGPNVEAFAHFDKDGDEIYLESRPGMFVFEAIKTEEEVFSAVEVMERDNLQSHEHQAIIEFMLGKKP